MMRIKVCGMRDPKNIHQADKTGVDMMGFIFYEGSSRYVGDMPPVPTKNVKRVGVFVNEDPIRIIELAELWRLDFLQLHGDESPEVCSFLNRKKMKVVKAFSVGQKFDFSQLEPYVDYVSFFLFDAAGQDYGGNGKVFDWRLFENYNYEVPFWLAGGIGPSMANQIMELNYPLLYAVDVNSGFEEKPGLKNIEKLKQFRDELQD